MTTTRQPDADIDPRFLDRWSPRAMRPDALTPAQLASLFEAMRWAPSCFNEQPWRVVYAESSATEDHARLCGLLVPANQSWACRAPLLLILFARRSFSHNDKPNRTAAFDVGSAWMALALEARVLGLYSHAMAGFDTARAYSELGVDPEKYEALAAVAVGALGDPADLPENYRARETPSGRKPQSHFVFPGRFPTEPDPAT